MKKHYCKDCGKETRGFGIRCKSCAAKERIKKYGNPNLKDGIYGKQLFCMDCNKPLSNNRVKRCPECYHKFSIGKNASNYKDGRTNKKYYCKQCKKEISITSALYGSELCKGCVVKEQLRIPENNPMFGVHRFGKNSPNWIDGRSFDLYPLEFNDILKESIRKRDNYECQNCSMTEEEHLIIIGQILHIHHIDYNKQNCNEDNLITTCKQCNLRANANRDYWINFYKNKLINIYDKTN